MSEEIVLQVNGQTIGLNDFVQKALAGTIRGFISVLRDFPAEVETIEIKISKQGG